MPDSLPPSVPVLDERATIAAALEWLRDTDKGATLIEGRSDNPAFDLNAARPWLSCEAAHIAQCVRQAASILREVERLPAASAPAYTLPDEAQRLRSEVFELTTELDALRASSPAHPGYGPCDAFGPNDSCSICTGFVATVQGGLVAADGRVWEPVPLSSAPASEPVALLVSEEELTDANDSQSMNGMGGQLSLRARLIRDWRTMSAALPALCAHPSPASTNKRDPNWNVDTELATQRTLNVLRKHLGFTDADKVAEWIVEARSLAAHPSPVSPTRDAVEQAINRLEAACVGPDDNGNDDYHAARAALLALPVPVAPGPVGEDSKDAMLWRWFRDRAWVGTTEDNEVCLSALVGEPADVLCFTDAERELFENDIPDDKDMAPLCQRIAEWYVSTPLPRPEGERPDA